jgi:hypothetical protein
MAGVDTFELSPKEDWPERFEFEVSEEESEELESECESGTIAA